MKQTVVDTNGAAPSGSTTYKYEYDASGVRISQTIGNAKTIYVVDGSNPTGYAQVLEEKSSTGSVTTTYTIGLDIHAQAVVAVPANVVRHFLTDGHGSTRGLFDNSGNIVVGSTPQLFAYDAYGNLLNLSGYATAISQALTAYLYSGERTDRTGLQYLRARFYDPATGRFNRLDPFAGNFEDPLSLHKYLYTHSDPVNGIDPTGEYIQLLLAALFGAVWGGIYDYAHGNDGIWDGVIAGALIAGSAALGLPAIGLSGNPVWAVAIAPAVFGGVTIGIGEYRDWSNASVPTPAQERRIWQAGRFISQVDSAWSQRHGGLAIVPVFGLTDDRGQSAWARVVKPGNTILIDSAAFTSQLSAAFFASLIVHEATHVDQGRLVGVRTSVDTQEREAYQMQSDFLRRAGISGTVDQLANRFSRNLDREFLSTHAHFFKYYGIQNPAFVP
jgi:RHS repeat-associated protein